MAVLFKTTLSSFLKNVMTNRILFSAFGGDLISGGGLQWDLFCCCLQVDGPITRGGGERQFTVSNQLTRNNKRNAYPDL